ncbi:ribosomal large subunit pseudouridine synthase E [Luminiphilus syltensis NOR5-1B]|uniref:Pseudouridine synthase n=1 Tax=Luminiphilus syltensis NOR5-1B TaxID=565045 RepID=B8KRL5_9GAMM|nr:pseudouridine synthase [Luminiphilus syltensis]EED36174.1 ribosomal large subunit pseudouridine synthase E [Luminiphilus syltensis NOR5-1B]
MSEIILINKPFRVLSQFTDREQTSRGPRKTLADYLSAPGFRVAGRLDYDSEGLLLLTNDGVLQQRIANPRHKQWKTYWVQIEGAVNNEILGQLMKGVELKDGPTQPCKATAISEPALWSRDPPVRYRRNVPDSWIEMSLREGRNRQIRRMTAAVGFPTLRLVRRAIGPWQLDTLRPGEHRRLTL